MQKFILIFLCLTQTALSSAQEVSSSGSSAEWDSKFKRIDSLHAAWDNPKSPGCAYGIIKDGKWIHQQAFGMANIKKGVEYDSETLIDIASESKQFTGFSILLLEEAGKLSIDDDVRKYLPEFRDYGHVVTINHLLTHTSGVRDSYNLMEAYRKQGPRHRNHEFLRDLILKQEALSFVPGTDYSYSNSGYVLLVELVERVSGMNFETFTHKHIFAPLGMTNTYFNRNDSVPDLLAAPYHVKNAAKPEKGMKRWRFFSDVAGPCGLITNLNDLLLWDANFYDNKLGKSRPELMLRFVEVSHLNSGQELRYGKGLVQGNYHGTRVQMHGGGAWHQSQIMRFPDQKITFIRLSNDSRLHSVAMLGSIANILLDTIAYQQKFATNNTSTLVEGAYQVRGNGLVRWLENKDGKWYYKATPSSTGEQLLDGPNDLVLFENDDFFTLKTSLNGPNGQPQLTMHNCDVYYMTLNKLPALVDSANIEQFKGTYYSEALKMKVRLKATKKGLKVTMRRIPLTHLAQASEFIFAVPGEKLSVEFKRDDNGEIVGFYANMWRSSKYDFVRR
jgi:CubicO group peptidase (beta-lactamase class C family)